VTDQIIENDKVVMLAFELRDSEGELIDGADEADPFAYLHGADNLVPGLEDALAGKKVGDALEVVVPPEEGYGPRQPVEPQPVPRDAFPEEVEVEAGMPFWVEDDEGDELELYVVEVNEDQVLVDVNHPLAGLTLHFQVQVLEIRDATAEEKAHGHPHVGETIH
jgi:FKBP-type peptidyl-prolyl cis-trans isomerase SlyD